MKFPLPEPLRAAFQSLRAHRMRSLLTTLGIIVGVGSVVMIIQLTKGMEGRILMEVNKQGAHRFRLNSEIPNPLLASGKARFQAVEAAQLAELRERVPQIMTISPMVQSGYVALELKHHGIVAKPNFTAVDEHGLDILNLEIAAGRGFTPTDRIFKSPCLILGKGLAQKLGLDESAIGQQLTYGGQTAELVGILKPMDIPMGGDDGDEFGPDAAVYFPFGAFRELLPAETYREADYHILVARSISLEQAEEVMSSTFRAIRGIRAAEPDNFTLESSRAAETEIRSVMKGLTLASSGLLSLSLLVGGIGVMNIMLVTVKERTREIGVRKAMGARRGAILLQFLVEAVILCLLGGLVGLLLGQTLGQVLSRFLLHHVEPPSILALAVAFLVPSGVGLCFGFFPARKAATLDPIEALRYE